MDLRFQKPRKDMNISTKSNQNRIKSIKKSNKHAQIKIMTERQKNTLLLTQRISDIYIYVPSVPTKLSY